VSTDKILLVHHTDVQTLISAIWQNLKQSALHKIPVYNDIENQLYTVNS